MTAQIQPSSNIFGLPIRSQFPIFEHSLQHRAKPLIFLDSAASSQKPTCVIDRLSNYLKYEHANVHRGAYALSANATDAYEAVRKTAADFIGATETRSIIFTKGTTESINLAAFSLEDHFNEGDSILLTILEHHSNIVPWQILAKRRKLNLYFADIAIDGSLDLDDFRSKVLEHKPKLISCTLLANALGTVTPVEKIADIAKEAAALLLLDAAQLAAHEDIDVRRLGCDFLVFSSHKLYGPTGAGVLFASDRALNLMQPVFGGGNMISSVTTVGSEWADPPQKFEAGTPAIAEVLGMGTALEFLSNLKLLGLAAFEYGIFKEFLEALRREPGVQLYGPLAPQSECGKSVECAQTSIITFNVESVHPHDFATVADEFNLQLRAGHHCAQPLMSRLGLQSTARISIAAYSDTDQIEPLLEAIRYARKVFG